MEPPPNDQIGTDGQQTPSTIAKLNEEGYQIYYEKAGVGYGVFCQNGNDPTKKIIWKGQKNYDDIGDLVIAYIQDQMVERFGLLRIEIPENKHLQKVTDQQKPKCDIYMTRDFYDPEYQPKNKKALVLIQGTGQVRAGVWARSVCINESIEKGSMLPQIDAALKNGCSVIVFNPNLNRKEGVNIPYCRSMESHSTYVWHTYVEPAKHFEELYIIAHSAGGGCLSSIQLNDDYKEDFYARVKKVALTDSWHVQEGDLKKKEHKKWMRENFVHYVASEEPVGKDLDGRGGWFSSKPICKTVSAGHPKHEYTTGYAHDEIVKQFGFVQIGQNQQEASQKEGGAGAAAE
ncbi:hypothetical protein FGO68_gene14982 [Halteria grandinella]|uniref:Arb2 domain-containing protein n=1 Tax=Halteria grandinella TaxID=5974 RepID=A0A8J8T2T6_HALGN|nr:hypothetical protein FGO68_gene14982 [Halteria grandinella]